jgi:hypothetical protein
MSALLEEWKDHVTSQRPSTNGAMHPSMLLLNPTNIAKPNALDHLKANVLSFSPDVVLLVES